jgi:predicted HTH domain antitoxin
VWQLFLNNNISLEIIAKITGLSLEKVQQLQAESSN